MYNKIMATKHSINESYTLIYGDLPVSVTRKKVKNINIRVHNDSRVTLTAPLRTSEKEIISMLEKHMAWIFKTQERFRAAENDSKQIKDEKHITIFGKVYAIMPVKAQRGQKTKAYGDTLYVATAKQGDDSGQASFAKAEEYAKEQLLLLLYELNDKWSKKTGLAAKKITIRRMHTRYGSMNVKTASMNIALCMYEKDPSLIEYVVVHELCHLKEANHSPRFHALVQALLPDAKEREKRLKGRIQKLPVR